MTDLNIDLDAVVDFLVGLLNTPSPTGYHPEAIAYVQEKFAALDMLELWTTKKGALMAKLSGEASDKPIGLTAHADTLGLMVTAINETGTLKCTAIGGLLWNGAENEGVTVRTHDNKRIRGTLILHNTSVHVNREAATEKRNADTMEVRLDEKVKNKEDVEKLGIGVGDFVFIDPRVEVTDSGFIKSRFLDDKASVACIYGALMALKSAGATPKQDVYILISNYEEVGHGGAAGFPELEEMLCIDMAALGDGLSGDEYSVTVCVKDSSGPYHFEMNNKLRKLAGDNGIDYKVDIYPFYGSDGSAFWYAGNDARVGLIGPGVAASHSYERTHREAIQQSAHLIALYMLADVE